MDNEIDRKIDVTAILLLLVQNRHQTHDWTLIGSDANGLGIQKCGICHFLGDSGAFSNRKLWKSIVKNEFFTIYSLQFTLSCKNKFLRLTWPKITKVSFHQNPLLIKYKKSTNIFFKSAFFVFVLQCIQREKMFTMKKKISRPETLVNSYFFMEYDNPFIFV